MAKEVKEIASPFFHACGATLYKILPETSADQVWVSGVTLHEHLEGIARAIAGSSVFRFVNTIPERNLLTNLNVGDRVYVTDASADPQINQAVPASYIWMPTHEWRQIGQAAPPNMNDYVAEGGGLAVTSQGKLELSPLPWQAGLLANAEIIITESGQFTAPESCWYEATLIGGGDGGWVGSDFSVNGGMGCAPVTSLIYLTKGQIVPVSIGAGGLGTTGAAGKAIEQGGVTSFGSYQVSTRENGQHNNGSFYMWLGTSGANSGYAYGGGQGGGKPMATGAAACAGQYYGAGGGAYSSRANNQMFSGNGHQGAVILRYYSALANDAEAD